jgi:ferredoxin-NADP reductase
MATPGANSDTILTRNSSTWQSAKVRRVIDATPNVHVLEFELPHEVKHLPGQHYEIRLTAADGYQAARLYSAASPARGDNLLEIAVELHEDGEVSPYLFGQLKLGDEVEIRGPLGKFFVWDPSMPEPILLIGGGSGIIPMRCILMTHQASKVDTPVRVLYSARDFDDILFKSELLDERDVTITLTGEAPKDWPGEVGRINLERIQAVLATLPSTIVCYVCGMNNYVEAVTQLLIMADVPPARIKGERFGS